MATPRSEQIDLECTPYYHCISRVVRRAFLCGTDTLTCKNFDHRKAWLVKRFKSLAKHIKPILKRLNLTHAGWLMMVNHLEADFGHAIGHQEKLSAFKPERIRKFKGSAKAKLYYAA